MLTKVVPVEDALVLRVGPVQDFRDRLADAEHGVHWEEMGEFRLDRVEPEQPACGTVLASIRDMIPGIAKVPTIREAFL